MVKRTGPRTEPNRDATGKFDRIRLHVTDRHVLEPVVQI